MKLQRLLFWISRGANYDFCPWCNVLTDRLKEPLGWVISAIAFSLLVGLMVGPQGYILASAFSALLVLGLIWPWLSMKAVRCQLVMPDRRVEEDQELELVFRVRNFWPLPIFGMMVKGEFLQGDDEEEAIAFALKRVDAWSESEFRLPLTPRHRGKLPTGKVCVSSGFPFGLMDFDKAVDVLEPTLVWPTCVSLEGFPVSDSTRFCLEGTLRDVAGNDGDSIGVRAYQLGDGLKDIHWSQSARCQKLMVRERQSISSTGATILMDLTPEGHCGNGRNSSFEWTIRIAASICAHLHETHSPVRVVCWGLNVDWNNNAQACENNRNGLRPLMDFLARLPTHAQALKLSEAVDAADAVEVIDAVDAVDSRGVRQKQPRTSAFAAARFDSGHLFVVGSNESTQILSATARGVVPNVTPVVVDFECFTNAEEISSSKSAAGAIQAVENGYREKEVVLIETPEAAADQFASRWNRSFNDVV